MRVVNLFIIDWFTLHQELGLLSASPTQTHPFITSPHPLLLRDGEVHHVYPHALAHQVAAGLNALSPIEASLLGEGGRGPKGSAKGFLRVFSIPGVWTVFPKVCSGLALQQLTPAHDVNHRTK